ncbi:MAG: S9 family peptidase [Pirellulales bacterium]
MLNQTLFLRSLLLLVIVLSGSSQAQNKRMTPEKLYELRRVGDAAVSPDGKTVAYLVTDIVLADNGGTTSLYVQPINSQTVSQPVADPAKVQTVVGFGTPLTIAQPQLLLKNVKGLNSLSWIHRPEGDRLIYIAPGKTNDISSPQAWMLNPATPNEPIQITQIKDGIGNLKAAPSGNKIAFTVNIKLDQTVNEKYPDLPKADARIIDSLLYRHWNVWHDFTYSHVHVAELNADGTAGKAVDLMENMQASCPLPPMGGAEQFEFSPDGTEIALSLKLVNNPAESTDSGVYLIPSGGGVLRHITPGMPGYDLEPRYSPDGRFIAFHSMERPGFEADRNRIMLYDRVSGTLRDATLGLDQTCHNAQWSDDSKSVYFHSEVHGTQQLYKLNIESTQPAQVSKGWFDFAVVGPVHGGPWVLVKQQNILRPSELAMVNSDDGSILTLTSVNESHYKDLELPKVEERHFTATDGKQIHCWVVLPSDFDRNSNKQYPMLTYCQGGPQGQIGQWFSYRWNFHLMASQGYAVLAVNRRGLPGFGRQWNDQISGDWGGQAMHDILAATDGMLADPKIDRKHVAAVGASFGGYTVYWLMGNAQKRFCAMISHCGVFNLESMYGSTEELFFVNFDLGGPYWKNQEAQAKYQQFSPHKFVGNWETPLLVIHGEKDFRVPITQGMEAFTAAQVQGIPSRFLYFPEEGHWVNKPQNGVLWSRVFFEWLDTYCKPKSTK